MSRDSRFDPSQNFLYRASQPLDALFLPKNIAVIGAKETEGSVGRTIMANLTTGTFKGKIYPVNPKHEKIFGLKAYPKIGMVPEQIDLVVIVTPAKTVPGIVAECVEAKVRTAIIISAGFKELGAPGIELEQQILKVAGKGNLRIVGPNCLGVMNPVFGLNATFAAKMATPGNIAFISQSGAMCTAVLDWSFKEKIGFSSFVSIGSMADINWGDLIDYLGGDPHTKSILIYMESIGNPRAFLSSAREVALIKPIIVIKAGRTEAAAKAAVSHTGSLAGSDEVFDVALRRVGVLRVNAIGELFNMASVLAKQPLPKGPRLTIVTNAGGPGVLATDSTATHGAELSPLDPETVEKLDAFLPPAWSHGNPVDLLGDATAERYAKAIELLAKDTTTEGILVILSPQDMTDPTRTAEALVPYAHLGDKPLLASWMGGVSVEKGVEILNDAGIPAFEYPDNAAQTFATMWRYADDLRSLYETPPIRDEVEGMQSSIKHLEVKKIIEQAKKEKRTVLTEFESKKVLACYGIPIVETLIARTLDEAVKTAEKLGFPIVLKLFSETITHKTEVGGVKLNLRTRDDVAQAFEEIEESVTKIAGREHFQGVTVQKMIRLDGYELILGSSTDEQFGPVLLFGMGGQLVEVFKDRALALPPLNASLARKMMEQTRIYSALQGVRGRKSVDLEKLEQILVRFSQMIVEHRWIRECDINPLLASDEQLIALDARIVLHDLHLTEEELPSLPIRPYPIEYVFPETLKNGMKITLRPIRPEDEPLLVEFHKELSEKSVRGRFFAFVSLDARIAHDRLIRICYNDYDREIGLIAEDREGRQIIGAARVSKTFGTHSGYFSMIIGDHYQYLGLGTRFLKLIIDIARKEGIHTLSARILEDNDGMLKICQREGFSLAPDPMAPSILNATLELLTRAPNR